MNEACLISCMIKFVPKFQNMRTCNFIPIVYRVSKNMLHFKTLIKAHFSLVLLHVYALIYERACVFL